MPIQAMSGYSKAALAAVKRIEANPVIDPVIAWNSAVTEVFPHSLSQQRKCCPKAAFLGLCEEGRVKGVKKGHYTRSKLNKKYAMAALHLLSTKPELAVDRGELWRRLIAPTPKVQNGQLDVVLALWDAGLLQM